MPDSWDFSNPRQREAGGTATPFLTYALCGLCILITLAYHTSDQVKGTLWYQVGHFGYEPVDQIWEGHYLALFTSVFMHADLMHILFNMLWLLRLGAVLELTISPLVYGLFFVAAAVIGSAMEIAFSSTTGIGASGVVYAMFGLLWAGRGRFPEWRAVATRNNLNIFIIWGIFCVFATWANIMPVANAAHGGGFLFGLAVGWLFFAPRRQPLWAIPLALLGIGTVLSVTWMPWSSDWNFWKGYQEFQREHYHDAITYYQRSIRLGTDDPATNWHNISAAWHNIGIEERQQNHLAAALQAEAEEQNAAAKAGPVEPDQR